MSISGSILKTEKPSDGLNEKTSDIKLKTKKKKRKG
jgi:hypothetical protein